VPQWSASLKKARARASVLVWLVGVPPQIRKEIWPMCIGNSLMISRDLYDIFRSHALNARKQRQTITAAATSHARASVLSAANGGSAAVANINSPRESPLPDAGVPSPALVERIFLGKESTHTNIEVDLARTFPALAFFQEGCMNTQLRDILETYVFYRPDVGYVQGMSYVAGNLLLHLKPYEAFVAFANILNAPFFHCFLKLDPEKMRPRFAFLESLIADHLPAVHRHFSDEDIEPQLCRWCECSNCDVRLSPLHANLTIN
jgi:hypothetical protein